MAIALTVVAGSATAWAKTPVGALSKGTYVALGDSYSSGEGNPPFIQPNPGPAGPVFFASRCDRSVSQAWPELAASKLAVNLDLLACAGATTDALTSSYDSQDPQLADLQSATAPALVTITMGGNDLGFVWVLANCYASLCAIGLSGVEGALAGGFGTHMTHVYEEIKAAAPGAQILVVGYPQIVPSNAIKALAHCPWFKEPSEILQMRAVTSQVNSVLARAAAAAGVNYVSTLDVLKGHELCTADSWVNSVSANPLNHGQGHPNAQGQAAIAVAVEDYVVHHHLLP